MCVCVCVWFGSSRSFQYIWLNNKGTFCLYNFFKILSSSLMCLGFGLELVDKFTKIVLSAFGPFIGHHQGLRACLFFKHSIFLDNILFLLIAFCFLNSSASQFDPTLRLCNFVMLFTKTIQIRRTRHAGHCWRSRDKLISDVLQWTPSHSQAKAGRSAWTNIQKFSEDTGCSPEDLPEVMNDREEWRERFRDIHADDMTRWWWCYKKLKKTLSKHTLYMQSTPDDGLWKVWKRSEQFW